MKYVVRNYLLNRPCMIAINIRSTPYKPLVLVSNTEVILSSVMPSNSHMHIVEISPVCMQIQQHTVQGGLQQIVHTHTLHTYNTLEPY